MKQEYRYKVKYNISVPDIFGWESNESYKNTAYFGSLECARAFVQALANSRLYVGATTEKVPCKKVTRKKTTNRTKKS